MRSYRSKQAKSAHSAHLSLAHCRGEPGLPHGDSSGADKNTCFRALGHPKQGVVFRCTLHKISACLSTFSSSRSLTSAVLAHYRGFGRTRRTDKQAWAFAERANRGSIRPLSERRSLLESRLSSREPGVRQHEGGEGSGHAVRYRCHMPLNERYALVSSWIDTQLGHRIGSCQAEDLCDRIFGAKSSPTNTVRHLIGCPTRIVR